MPSTKSEKTPAAGTALLSPTRENYLKFIYLEEREAGFARACNLAQLMGVTRSTVATTFRELKADGLIAYEPYSPIRLTEAGRAIAEEIVRRNAVIKRFFESVLDLDEAVSEKIACELEHVLSTPVLGRLERFEKQLALHQGFWKAHEAAASGHPGEAHPHPAACSCEAGQEAQKSGS